MNNNKRDTPRQCANTPKEFCGYVHAGRAPSPTSLERFWAEYEVTRADIVDFKEWIGLSARPDGPYFEALVNGDTQALRASIQTEEERERIRFHCRLLLEIARTWAAALDPQMGLAVESPFEEPDPSVEG